MSSVVNSSSTPLAGNAEFPGAWEFLTVDKHGVEVVCSTDAPGNLVIEFSQNKVDINYTHTFTIEADVSFSRAVSKKGNYYRVRLVNGPSAQTTLQLVSIIQTTYQPDTLDVILDAATSSITIYGQDGDGTKRVVKTTADGSLVVSGGGSGGGDATAANQVASNTAICARLDTIDTSTNNMEVVLDELIFTSGNLHVRDDATLLQLQGSNLAQWNKLNLIEQGTEISSGYLQSIDTLLTPLQQGIARYTLDATTTLAPDTVPSYKAPPSSIAASEGWYYKNLALDNASQLYYYANQASQTKNFDYEIATVQSQWAVVRILSLNSATGLPFLVVYSQPQGAGDNIPGFARSVWVYQILSSAELRLGEKIVIYRGTAPDLRVFPELRRVECVLSTTRGPALTTEKLAYGTVNTDSAAAVGNAEYIISGAGLTFAGDHVYKVELTAETAPVAGGDASASNQVLQLTETQNSNLAMCDRLDWSNTSIVATKDELITLNSTFGALIDGTSSMYVRLDGTDDAVQIWGFNPDLAMPEALYTKSNSLKVNVDNPITDYATETTLSGLSTLITNQSAYSRFQTEAPVSDGKLDTIISNMSLTNFNVNNLTKCDTDAVVISSGSVSVSGDVGLVVGTQVTLTNSTVGLIENTVVGLSAGSQVELINSSVGLTAGAQVEITNASVAITSASALSVSETNPITGYATETTLGDIKTQTDKLSFVDKGTYQNLKVEVDNATLDTHCFASSDGTSFHHIHSDNNGNIITLSRTHDGSGNDIASLVSEADGRALNTVLFGYDAADDAVKRLKIGEGPSGGLYVENAPATNLVVGKGLPTYSALYSGALNAADNFGNLTVAEYSTCDIMIKIPANACTASGYAYVSFSEDGSAGSWYDTSIGVNINTSASDKTYWLNVPSFCMSHISITGRSPWGSGTLATTNSIIRICLKK